MVGRTTALSAVSQKLIRNASARGELFLSPVSAWEIATLARRGRIELTTSPRVFVTDLFARPEINEAPVDFEIASTAGELDDGFHGDPADRFIVATAIVRGYRLMTRDIRILDYGYRTRRYPSITC